MELVKLGFFKELPHGDKNGMSIKDFINCGNSKDNNRICNYLESGIPLILCAGTSYDILRDDGTVSGVPNILTDGTYVWPGDLSYYVKEYNLKLSDNFINVMKNNSWIVPIKQEDIIYEEISIDGKHLFI